MMVRLAVGLSSLCIVAMILIDRAMGPRAEFLNAWSVVERLSGRAPTAGESVVARHLGGLGELATVLVANAAIGTVLAAVARSAARLLR